MLGIICKIFVFPTHKIKKKYNTEDMRGQLIVIYSLS